MKAVIICNGTINDYSYYDRYLKDTDYIICVDGGASHARKLNVRPDVLIGDFDSIAQEDFTYFTGMGVETVRFPKEKDTTDTELAIDYAAGLGCESIVFVGGLGSRIDHSLANIMLLKKMLDRGIKGMISDEYNKVTLINDRIKLNSKDGFKVSLIPITDKVKGVTTRGLYYPLNNATIEIGSTWGISNEFTGNTAEVTITSGLMLVVMSRD